MKTIDKQILLYNRIDNSIIVSFKNTNKLNILNSNVVESKLLKLVKGGGTSVILDFSNIDFIDSAGFHALLSVYIDSKLNQVEFIIINAKQEVIELFNLVELNNVFVLKNSSDFNLKQFRRAS